MTNALLLSHFVLWVLVVVQTVVMLVIVRQVGLLYLRSGASRARLTAVGPELGEVIEPITLHDIDDAEKQMTVGPAMDSDVLLVFVSPDCAACETLLPALRPLVGETRAEVLWVLLATSGTRERCVDYRERNRLGFVFFAYDAEASPHFKVGGSPYALLIRSDGTLVSKGIVNHIDQLESVLSARERRGVREAELSIPHKLEA
jgi:methylamine dehydrogenase accessory protein MauD